MAELQTQAVETVPVPAPAPVPAPVPVVEPEPPLAEAPVLDEKKPVLAPPPPPAADETKALAVVDNESEFSIFSLLQIMGCRQNSIFFTVPW